MRFLCLVITLGSLVAEGQRVSPAIAPDQQQQNDGHAAALAVLHDAIEASRELSQPANRIYIEGTCIELLWDSDEGLARSLVKSIEGHYHELDRQISGTRRSRRDFLQQAYFLRQQIIEAVASHDPSLALEFLRQTRPPAGMNNGTQEADLELVLAMRAARQNAKLALDLASKNNSMNGGMIANVLDQAYQADPAAATQAAGEMVRKLTAAPASDRNAFFSAFQLLQYYGRAGQDTGSLHSGRGPAQHPVLTPALLQQVAGVLIVDAQQPNLPGDLRQMLQYVTPTLEKISPAAMAVLNAAKPADQADQSIFLQRLNEVTQSGTIQQGIELAEHAPEQFRWQAYEQVATKLASNGNLSDAAELLERSPLVPEQRQQIIQNVTRNAAFEQANVGAFDKARAAVNAIEDPEERAAVLIQLAQSAMGRKQNAIAETLLSDARALLPSSPTDLQELNGLVQLANAYAGLDPAEAAGVLEALIGEVNNKLPPLALVDGFVGQQSFLNGEMLLQFGAASQVIREISGSLASLAAQDPDSARGLAAEFQRPEARTIAYLEMARRLFAEARQRSGVRVLRAGGGAIGGTTDH